MTVKIALDAGHGMNTAGKRTPDDEREWSFNDIVLRYVIAGLKPYANVEVLRLDDPTGKTDVPLTTRTKKANDWKADVLVSIHHNANTGSWGNHTGTETYIYPGSTKGRKLAEAIHPQLVKKFGLKDRGIKEENFHMLRESLMPAILTEGGYMDSRIDIVALRDESRLKVQAEGIVLGLVQYFGLTKSAVKGVTQEVVKEEEITLVNLFKPSTQEGRNALLRALKRFEAKEPALSTQWREKVEKGTFTEADLLEVIVVAIDRGYITGIKG